LPAAPVPEATSAAQPTSPKRLPQTNGSRRSAFVARLPQDPSVQ
jgi:hypothetical protein